MTFIQQSLLMALPAAALPIAIHLINRYRHRTMPWAAMMFLLDAKKMTHGMARVRHILILAMRVIAIAGLVFAISRPLASGWLGLTAGGEADTTIILLDRSASMEQQDLQSGRSKRQAALEKVSGLLGTIGRNTKIVLIESTSVHPQELDSSESLIGLPDSSSTDTSADIPSMLQAASEYMDANQTGRTDIWLCSDLRRNDWSPDSGRWELIRDGFSSRDGTRLYLLSFPDMDENNLSISVDNVQRRQIGESAELQLDITLEKPSDLELRVPVQLVINGARTELVAEMKDRQHVIQGHSVPIDQDLKRGWGRVELPRDSNQRDNVFHFVFAEPPVSRTTVVSDDPEASALIRLAVETPMDPSLTHEVTLLSVRQADAIAWDETALLIWQAEMPTGLLAKQVEAFLSHGKAVLFLPPLPDENSPVVPSASSDTATDVSPLFDVKWGAWKTTIEKSGESMRVANWRDQSDLLANSESGTALPVGKLRTFRYREISGKQLTTLARFEDGNFLLSRFPTTKGAAYFLSTLPQQSHSTLASDGVVFYITLQRALAHGAAALGDTVSLTAGSDRELNRFASPDAWKTIDESSEVLSSQRTVLSGVYEANGKLIALNRPLAEDGTVILDATMVGNVLGGIDYQRFDDSTDNSNPLASEIWRAFLIVMIVALVLEALLCLPPENVRPADATW